MEENKETDDQDKENVILMEQTEEIDFDSFQQEMKADEIEPVTYLESPMADFSTKTLIWIDNDGYAGMKIHYSYVFRIHGIDDGEMNMTVLRNTIWAKSKFLME
ncbi:hypothetical protein AVEN_98506-1 [Araneus ventricosus]|uniref:Uncharacterized protein n=1 Tax=Araneus ventricosus TaxID=182803 RepID=A0A4Y2ESC3_ARAVE|nr:hypothetical protein AVEN_98506-1 [Araneus ventricosus]